MGGEDEREGVGEGGEGGEEEVDGALREEVGRGLGMRRFLTF